MWLGLGVFTLAGASASAQTPPSLPNIPAVPTAQGGEGGEGGIDPELASRDPVEFLVAMDVIAAHYLAGRDIYRLGEPQAAGEMFAHPIAEVYSELEEVLTRLGVTPFRAEMERASILALDRASLPVVERAAAAVLAALIAAEAKAPSPGGIAKVQTIVIAAMADRAAQQYVSALREPDRLEPYLDGYGLYRAAAARFARLGSALRTDGLGPALPAIEAVLAALARAYPTATRPASPVPAAPLTQAAERLHQILN